MKEVQEIKPNRYYKWGYTSSPIRYLIYTNNERVYTVGYVTNNRFYDNDTNNITSIIIFNKHINFSVVYLEEMSYGEFLLETL